MELMKNPRHKNIDEIENELIFFVCRNFIIEADEFSREESLVDQGVVDSFGLVEISAFMERDFGIVVAESDMNRGNFGSIKKMVAYIDSKRMR